MTDWITLPWYDSVKEEPKRDGRYVLFARDPERAKEERCPYVFGFFHWGQNIPCWVDGYGMKIVLEHWPRWKPLPPSE